ASLQTATSPRVRAVEQSKLGRALAGLGGATGVGCVGGTGICGCPGAAVSLCGSLSFASIACGSGAGRATADNVANGVMIASAFLRRTTGPLPSAAAVTV